MNPKQHITGGVASVIPLLLLLASCSNDPVAVNKVSQTYEGPLRVQKDVSYYYTDSGIVQLHFVAPRAMDYSHLEEEPYMEFDEGLDVVFFDNFGEPETTLRCDYAIRYIEESTWEARGNVVVNNAKGEKLDTEKLIWDERAKRIRSDEYVKITTPESIIMGEGFEADQNMNDYDIYNVTGIIYLDESEADSTDTKDL